MKHAIWIAVAALALACRGAEEKKPAPAEPATVEVALANPQLRFTYLAKEGKFQLAQKVEEIPADARKAVMVVDLSRREAEEHVLVLDLTRTPAGGKAVAQRMDRAAFERLARGARAAERPPVIMYATSWCGVCRQARSFLAQHKVRYREHDIEKEPAAAAELKRKAAQAGVDARGVPVFDIGGKILPGFDPARLKAELKI